LSTHLSHIQLYHLTQTLTTLNLTVNAIGNEGATYVANALRHNNVSLVLEITHLLQMHLYHLLQTLTTLKIGWNRIGAEGARHIANALHHNTVRFVLYSSTSYIFVSFIAET
jgi:hypothetical protein